LITPQERTKIITNYKGMYDAFLEKVIQLLREIVDSRDGVLSDKNCEK